MMRILVAYEFGAGLGHLSRLLAVAQRLLDSHRVTIAIPNLSLASAVRRNAKFGQVEILAGVKWQAPETPEVRKIPTKTFADAIRIFDFHNRDRLRLAVQRWRQLLKAIAPDLIIADFAPSLRIAANGIVPTVVVGNGYSVPPGGHPLLPMRPWEDDVPKESRRHEEHLLETVNAIAREFSSQDVSFFSDLFQGEKTFVCTIAEFDPYARLRTEPQIWPFNIPDINRAVQRTTAPQVFCYFQRNHPSLPNVISAINELNATTQIYVQGADFKRVAARCADRVAVHRAPADFARILPNTSLLIHHAGLGTAYAGLIAAVPQLVLPLNLEHFITALGLEKFGASMSLPVNADPDVIRNAMQRLLSDLEVQSRSRLASELLERRRQKDPLATVLKACEALVPDLQADGLSEPAS